MLVELEESAMTNSLVSTRDSGVGEVFPFCIASPKDSYSFSAAAISPTSKRAGRSPYVHFGFWTLRRVLPTSSPINLGGTRSAFVVERFGMTLKYAGNCF